MKQYILTFLYATTVSFNVLAQYSYEKRIVQSFFSEPCKVVTGDLNNDTYEEVISAFKDKNYISFNINNAGVFSEPQVLFLDSSQYRDIVIVDINNDQLNDIVVTDFDHHRMGVFLNSNNFSFKDVQYFATGENPMKLYAHDFNQDDIADVAVLNQSSNAISLFFGDETSVLLPQTSYTTDAHPSDLNAGDFNADGYMDLVTLSKSSAKIQIFNGKVDGTFSDPYSIATLSSPVNVEVKDINGDSHSDLAVVYESSETVSIYYGNGQASFDLPTHIAAESALNDRDFLIEDLNEDGEQDLAVATYSSSSITFFIGQGNKTFDQHTYNPSAGQGGTFKFLDLYFTDVIKQGTKGLFITNTENAIFAENRYDEQYQFASSLEIAIWNDVYKFDVGDINSDGINDLLFSNYQFTGFKFISIFLGKGNYQYEFYKHLPNNVDARNTKLVDLNNDGLLDIVSVGHGAEIYLNSKEGVFTSFELENSFGNFFTVADFNEDAFQDVVVGSRLYLNSGDGHFVSSHYFGENIGRLTSLDFNDDSHVDLALSFFDDKLIRFYPGVGDGTFGSSFDLEKSIQPKGLLAADLNADNIDDLIISEFYQDTSYIYFGAKENAFSGSPIKFASTNIADEAYVFDIDENGIMDIIGAQYMALNYYPVLEGGTLDSIRYHRANVPFSPQIMQIDLDQNGSKELLILSERLLEIQTIKAPANVSIITDSKLYDGQPISSEIASTEPAGLPIKILYSNSTSLPIDVGTYEITAEIDDPQYKGSAKANFVINKAPLTVKANDRVMYQGRSIPELTYTITGFVQGEDSTDIDTLPTITTTATANSKEGTYDIVVSGAEDNNYTFSYVTGSLTIDPITFIDEELDIHLKVYPVPAEKYLTITNTINKIEEVWLKDMAGRTLYYVKHAGNGDLVVPVNQLKKSVYLLEILMKDQTKNIRKVIVE